MKTFTRTKYEDLPQKIRNAIRVFNDDVCSIDETQLTALELTTFRAFIAKEYIKFSEI